MNTDMEKAGLLSRSARPIICAEREWEIGGLFTAVGAFVEPDGESVRLYYRVSFIENPTANVLCVSYSRDLVHWERPEFSDGTNVVMRSSGLECGYGTFLPCRILTTGPANWSLLYWDRLSEDVEPGFTAAVSGDGLSWKPVSQTPRITNSNDAASMIEAIRPHETPLSPGEFYLYQQTWKHNPDLPTNRDNLAGIHRRISLWSITSLDGIWRGPVTILEPDSEDPPDVQFYWLSPFSLDDGYGGFLHCHHTIDQTMDIQLVSSPDGWQWKRHLNRRPFLPTNAPGSFDCGMISVWGQPITFKGRTLVFYSGRSTLHDHTSRYPDIPVSDEDGIGIAEISMG